jgi:malonyl CoA-acyl carrier protein transacylase
MAADCRARCVDGADLGVAEHAATIANADPRCPVHGNPDAVARYIAALERVAQLARAVRLEQIEYGPSHTASLDELDQALSTLDLED